MDIYRRCWLTGAVLAVAVGLAFALVGLPVVAVLAVAVCCGLISLTIRLSRTGGTDRARESIRTSVVATLVGAAIGPSVAGWINETEGYGLVFVLLVAAAAPAAVERYRRLTTRTSPTTPTTPTADPSPTSTAASPPALEMLVGPNPAFPWEGSLPDLHGLTDDELVFIWQSSYTTLGRCRSAADVVLISETRRRCLDEIERRDPEGFARWVGAGARAASDPRKYLHK